MNLSFALNHAISGEAVWSYHAVNLLIHAGAGLALFGLVRRTLALPGMPGGGRAAADSLALAVAGIWLAHPLQTESVTSIVQRTESLVGLFYLLTFYAFVRALTAGPRARVWQALAVAACLVGMTAKEVMVTAPVMVWLYDRTFAAGSFRAALRQRPGLYAALAATWLLLGWLLLHTGGSRGEAAGFGLGVTPWTYALTQCRAILLYLQLALWPHPLVFDYGTAVVRDPAEVAGQIAVLAALAGGTLYALWRHPRLGFLGAWFLVILSPSSSIVPLVSQTIAEHRMYLPLAAVVALVVIGGHQRLGRPALAGAFVLVPVCAFLTVQRNTVYRSEEALWADTVAKVPENPRARVNLAEVYLNQRRADLALEQALAAVRLRPDHAEAQTNLGIAYALLGRLPEALTACGRAAELRPDYARGRSNYGIVLAQSGRWTEAIVQFEAALPHAVDAREALAIRGNLARALLRAGRLPEAIAQLESVLAADPQSAEMRYHLAMALGMSGREAEAIAALETVLRLEPDHAAARAALEAARGPR
ncbi:MAG: tetratricopeptide repeat protein [Opitutaceae bacterium]|nr:tetratricopeptide repeat protein [Opitutaceae bacterium]